MKVNDKFESLMEQYPFSFFDYVKNDLIFSENEPFRGVYFVVTGSVKIEQMGSKKELLLWVAQAKDLVGVVSYFNDLQIQNFSATACENTRCYFVDRATFDGMLTDHPDLKQDIIKLLCSRINFIEKRLISFSANKIRKRIPEVLAMLMERYTKEHLDVAQIPTFQYLAKDIADMVGTSVGYLKKVLKKEAAHHSWFKLDKDTITILNGVYLSHFKNE